MTKTIFSKMNNTIGTKIPTLSIVTVVFNDLEGLKHTVDSLSSHRATEVDYWVIDGKSSDGTRDFLTHHNQHWINFISEPDNGLYDAMNTSFKKVSGDFVLFVNAGDILHEDFNWPEFFKYAGTRSIHKVLIGRTIEKYKSDRYLRPGIGKRKLAFKAPPHQATFYPRVFFSKERFKLDYPIGADGEYTGRAIANCGAVFVPQVVSEFLLGGLSSSYGSIRSIKYRLREVSSIQDAQKLLAKVVMWHVLPRRLFYEVLSKGKYTKLS